MPRKVTDAEIVSVFEGWRARQARPNVCRLTEDRSDLIRARLSKGYSVDDLLTLVRYAFESQEADARFWRGDNARGRKYLDLANLLRAGKLAGRVEKARVWLSEEGSRGADFAGPFALVGGGSVSAPSEPDPVEVHNPWRLVPVGGGEK